MFFLLHEIPVKETDSHALVQPLALARDACRAAGKLRADPSAPDLDEVELGAVFGEESDGMEMREVECRGGRGPGVLCVLHSAYARVCWLRR